MERVCFVISPIGNEGSQERIQSDKFLGLIKEVGEYYNLNVIRADEVNGSTDINSDIIEKIQHADLCIIDLTGINPNVMYEFGMRYQTGLPYIVCARKETKLPFDVISRRTIFYGDLEKTSDYREAKSAIRRFVDKYEEQDYQNAKVVGNSELYQMLCLIVEKIESLQKGSAQVYSASNVNDSIGKEVVSDEVNELLKQLDPSEAFQYAYSTNQLRLAEQLLEYCRNQPIEYFLNKLCALAALGSQKAAEELLKNISEHSADFGSKELIEMLGSAVSCFNRQDIEIENLDRMQGVFAIVEERMSSNKERAAFFNQKERFYAGAGMYDIAKESAEKTLQLDDTQPAYFYNYAIVLEQLGKIDEALEYARRMISFETMDANHLAYACRLLKRSNDLNDVAVYEECLNKLEKISPYKARLVKLND
ncbi:MAG: hypothetical protein J6J38_06805 [Lachnospiraceae bacterium]|nr:hypothetical protein [Lachnospiraceae bacterium]